MRFGNKALHHTPFHHRGVVRVRHQHVLGVCLVGVADHAKQAFILSHTVDGELGIENLVAAVFAVRLGEHHQFHVGGVALELGERRHQVVDFIFGQRQTKLRIGIFQGVFATRQNVHMRHGRSMQFGEQLQGLGAFKHHALGHAIVQQRAHLGQLLGAEFGFAQQAGLEPNAVFHNALHPAHGQATVVGDVCGFGGPGGYRAKAGRHHDQRLVVARAAGW